jgi:hypothetical protein
MRSWFESAACRSGAHCATCRDRAAGAALRASIAAKDGLRSADFDCPHGRAWGYVGAIPAAASPPPSLYADHPTVQARRAVCATCDKYNGTTCVERFPAGCCSGMFAAFLAGGECPLQKWPSTAPAGLTSA